MDRDLDQEPLVSDCGARVPMHHEPVLVLIARADRHNLLESLHSTVLLCISIVIAKSQIGISSNGS